MKKKKKKPNLSVLDETTTIENQLYRNFLLNKNKKKKIFSKVIPKMYVNTFNLPHFAYCINYCICMFYTKTNNYASFFLCLWCFVFFRLLTMP